MKKVAVAFGVAVLALGIYSVFYNGGDERTDEIRFPVGEDAQRAPEYVEINSSVNPTKIRLEQGQSVVFRNSNSFPVSISFEKVENDFRIEGGKQWIFRPANEVSYVVESERGRIGEGRIAVGS